MMNSFGNSFFGTNFKSYNYGLFGRREQAVASSAGKALKPVPELVAKLNLGFVQIPKHKIQIFCKSLAWCTKYSQKINRITQMDCKSRDESNKPNYDVIRH